MSSAFHYALLMSIYGGCEIFAMKYDDLELLMAGGDDLDRCKNDDAHLAASLQPMALA